jgi:hypothetical protein
MSRWLEVSSPDAGTSALVEAIFCRDVIGGDRLADRLQAAPGAPKAQLTTRRRIPAGQVGTPRRPRAATATTLPGRQLHICASVEGTGTGQATKTLGAEFTKFHKRTGTHVKLRASLARTSSRRLLPPSRRAAVPTLCRPATPGRRRALRPWFLPFPPNVC